MYNVVSKFTIYARSTLRKRRIWRRHHLITIGVNIDKGIGYHLVGLPDNAIKESNFRIAAALQNIGYRLPRKKITINMAPADLRKEGQRMI